uniref:Uncharacterized protein n=1 Tax=uncultured marine virus TaxID=186617 RepID=A0A0F7L5F5_9VIRU|nr:hypothetical protein [uncultured marine virus]
MLGRSVGVEASAGELLANEGRALTGAGVDVGGVGIELYLSGDVADGLEAASFLDAGREVEDRLEGGHATTGTATLDGEQADVSNDAGLTLGQRHALVLAGKGTLSDEDAEGVATVRVELGVEEPVHAPEVAEACAAATVRDEGLSLRGPLDSATEGETVVGEVLRTLGTQETEGRAGVATVLVVDDAVLNLAPCERGRGGANLVGGRAGQRDETVDEGVAPKAEAFVDEHPVSVRAHLAPEHRLLNGAREVGRLASVGVPRRGEAGVGGRVVGGRGLRTLDNRSRLALADGREAPTDSEVAHELTPASVLREHRADYRVADNLLVLHRGVKGDLDGASANCDGGVAKSCVSKPVTCGHDVCLRAPSTRLTSGRPAGLYRLLTPARGTCQLRRLESQLSMVVSDVISGTPTSCAFLPGVGRLKLLRGAGFVSACGVGRYGVSVLGSDAVGAVSGSAMSAT